MIHSFPKQIRIRKRREYKLMAYHSKRHVGVFITIECSPNHLNYSRLGITASRHFGNAVQRNRFKRIVREAFRLEKSELWKGFDFNIRPRTKALQASCDQIRSDLNHLISDNNKINF